METITKEQEEAILPGLNALGATRTPENAAIVDPQLNSIIRAASRTAIPGTGMGGMNPMLSGMNTRRVKNEERLDTLEADYKESRAREEAFRTVQQNKLAPVGQQIKDKLAQSPTLGETVAIPAAPEPIRIDSKEMGETLSLITALAALGGALTRTPLTSALNSFTAGIQGYVTGNQKVFDDNLKTFNANLVSAKAQNDIIYQKYQAAKEKFGTDIQGLQNEYKLIAAETQNPIDMELARRGDLVTLDKISQQRVAMDDKIDTARLNLMDKIATHGQQQIDRAAAATLAQDRLTETTRHNKALEAQMETNRVERARAADAKIAATKDKAAAGGLKGKMLENFVNNEANIEGLKEIKAELDANPDAFGFKTLIPNILLNRADPEGVPVRASLANIVNTRIKTLSGATVTAQEWKRVGKGVPQDGDAPEAIRDKIDAMIKWAELENRKIMQLGGGGKPAAPAAATTAPAGDGWSIRPVAPAAQ